MADHQKGLLEQVWRGFKLAILIMLGMGILGLIMDGGNFHETQVRSRLSRVNNDLRSLGLAIENYHSDTKTYPTKGLASLTTPIPYLARYPVDPFRNKHQGSNDYVYWVGDGTRGWIVYSCGPDREYEIDPQKDYAPESREPGASLVNKTYDPTNGINSRGDVYKYKN